MSRRKRFNMLLSEDEMRMLRELAAASGLTVSDYLRTLVRREHWAGRDGYLTSGVR